MPRHIQGLPSNAGLKDNIIEMAMVAGVNFWPAADLSIGRHRPAAGVEYYFAGLIDEMRLWNRELSAGEVRLRPLPSRCICDILGGIRER